MHHIQQGAAIFVRGGDVQEAEFVGARLVIDNRLLHRIAGIAQAFEIDALDDPAVFHVQAGDDTHLEHYSIPIPNSLQFGAATNASPASPKNFA